MTRGFLGTRLAVLAWALPLLVGCSGGGNLGPSTSPKLGRYAYSFDATGLSTSGVMVLTYSAPDSIAGHFEVPAYTSAFDLGFLNAGAYIVYAHPTGGGLAQHRLTLNTAGGLDCTWGQWWRSSTDLRSASCSTVY